MTQTPERQTWRVQDAVLAGIGTWSTEEIKAEVNGTIRDLEKARTLELSARIRSVEKRTPETLIPWAMREGVIAGIITLSGNASRKGNLVSSSGLIRWTITTNGAEHTALVGRERR